MVIVLGEKRYNTMNYYLLGFSIFRNVFFIHIRKYCVFLKTPKSAFHAVVLLLLFTWHWIEHQKAKHFFEFCFHFLCVFFGGKYVLLFTADICFVAAKHFSATLNQKTSLVFRCKNKPARQEAQLMVFFQMKFTKKKHFYTAIIMLRNDAHYLFQVGFARFNRHFCICAAMKLHIFS